MLAINNELLYQPQGPFVTMTLSQSLELLLIRGLIYIRPKHSRLNQSIEASKQITVFKRYLPSQDPSMQYMPSRVFIIRLIFQQELYIVVLSSGLLSWYLGTIFIGSRYQNEDQASR